MQCTHAKERAKHLCSVVGNLRLGFLGRYDVGRLVLPTGVGGSLLNLLRPARQDE
jgi:hypothetical protein